jgi:hypothetical protein
MAYNAYDSGRANYEAARRGSLSPDWNSGIIDKIMSPASWAGGALGTAAGKEAGYYDNAPILSDAASATKFDPNSPELSQAEVMKQQLEAYYGKQDAAKGVDSQANSDLINGRGFFSSMFSPDTGAISSRSVGDAGVGGMGGSGAWNGPGGGGGWGGFGDSATRLPTGPQGSARGGPVHLGNNSFVVDARTVSEMGNGSSSAGQELLARLGGQPIHGPGDGVSDSIHASIGGKQEARVARDEVQFSPEAVARLGGGDASKGSKFLYSLMAKAREARIKAAKKDGGRGVDTGLRALVGAK